MTSPWRIGTALRRALALGLAAGLWLTVAIPAGATGSPDAHYTTSTTTGLPINGTQMLAETFTAQAPGQLDQVDLPLGGAWNAGGKIYIVPAGTSTTDQPGAMTSGSFGTYSGAMSCCSTYRPYTIAPAYSVTANGHFAVVVVPNPGTSVTWAEVTGGIYSGGKAWKGFQPSTWTPLAMAFDFKTYVTPASTPPPPASGPSVTRVKSDVPVTEGTAPTNSGSYAGAAGLTVHLTASSGTLSYTPSTSGNWTWTGSTDEGPSQTITIKADDGNGGSGQATFTTESSSVPPIATIHGAPSSVREGTTITLTAAALSLSAEDNTAGFKFTWSATEYGSALPGGSGGTYTFKVDDEGSYTITLQAADDGGFQGPATSVAISSVDSKPAVSGLQVSNPMIVTTQQSLTFTGTYADDGASVDSSYQATWNFGDGTSTTAAVPAGLSATHPYQNAGTYTATLTVKDDDGMAGSSTITVTVLSPLQAIGKIGTYLQGLTDVKEGQKNSLQAKLNAAAESYQRGDSGAACNQMNAFINEVDADQKSGRLTTAEAGTLTDAARLTQRSMGCFKPLVEFLSGL